jgi:hypothetical protein
LGIAINFIKLKGEIMVISDSLLEEALKLKPFEKLLFIQTLNKSLDVPDLAINDVWVKEVVKRVSSYEKGEMSILNYDDFKKQ